MSYLSQFASDLSRLHVILSVEDGDLEEYRDPAFEARIRRRLKMDGPRQVRQLQHIASEVAKLVSL